MSNIFDKFNKSVDLKGLKSDLKDVQENGVGNFEEVPVGKYEVAVDKMEVKATKSGDKLMLSVVFKIVAGNQKGRLIFLNQVLTNGFGLHNANELLRSLKSGVEIVFDDYSQYAEMVAEVLGGIKDNLEYELDYNENDKGYKTFEITDVFED